MPQKPQDNKAKLDIQKILGMLPHRYPFLLIDRVLEYEEGKSLVALKNVTYNEAFFQGHFPSLKVMPGVLLLEAMTQAGAWLIRLSEDFAHSLIVLRRATNIRCGRFVEPGETLTITAEVFRQDEQLTTLRARGSVAGQTAVNARLVLHRYNLADRDSRLAEKDDAIIRELRKRVALLYKPAAAGVEAPV